jgi:hypothetical protein
VDLVDTDTNASGPHPQPPGCDTGATDSVTALYDAYAVPMIRIALLMPGDRAAAEDVVQDAFFALHLEMCGSRRDRRNARSGVHPAAGPCGRRRSPRWPP